MYFAYFDESGDSGVGSGSPTRFFVLACVLVPAIAWESTLSRLIDLRRWLRDEYGVPVRPELKALDFVKGRGGFTGSRVDRPERLAVYAQCLRRVAAIPDVKVFVIAIEKQGASEAGWEPRTAAWTFALQRVDRFCRSRGDQAVIFPDEGHTQLIRPLLRRLRRFQRVAGAFGGKRDARVERILEDPNERDSQLSYLIQVADWAAYAAHRSHYVDPRDAVPGGLWDELGAAHLEEVNKVRGGPPALVRYP